MSKEKTNPRISVGIATRNAERHLPLCLRSLKAQTIKPNEYIICIGPSEDKTEEIIQEFAKQTSIPTKVIYDVDGVGTGYARKAMIENASQEYVVWADSDFILAPNWLDVIIKVLTRDNLDFLDYRGDENYITTKDAICMEMKGDLPSLIDISQLKKMDVQLGGIKAVRRTAALAVGNYDTYFPRGQDLDLQIRLVSAGYQGIGYNRMDLYHIWDGLSLKKALSRATYLKYLYKYGLHYLFLGEIHTEHLIAFLLRSCVMVSLSLIVFYLSLGYSIILPLSLFLVSTIGLMAGLILVHPIDSFSLMSCFNQFGKCFGEFYTLYDILTSKNRPKRGYGKKHLKKSQVSKIV